MPTIKVFIAGLTGSGKTELIKTISDLPLVSVEKKIVSNETIVPMDYGRINMDRNMIYFYAPVEEIRFDFLWESLADEMHGALLLVDSADRELFPEVAKLTEVFEATPSIPCLIVANKADLMSAAPVEEIRNAIDVSDRFGVMPCVATRKSSVRQVIIRILELILCSLNSK